VIKGAGTMVGDSFGNKSGENNNVKRFAAQVCSGFVFGE